MVLIGMLWRIGLIAAVCHISACGFWLDDKGLFRDGKLAYRQVETIDQTQIPDMGKEPRPFVDKYPVGQWLPEHKGSLIYHQRMPLLSEQQSEITIRQLDEQLWLTVPISVDQLWSGTKDFLLASNQWSLIREQPKQGLMHIVTTKHALIPLVFERGFQFANGEVVVTLTSDVQKDVSLVLLEQLAMYFRNRYLQLPYSLAAQQVNRPKRVQRFVKADGFSALALAASNKRGVFALTNALRTAGFVVDEHTNDQQWTVTYRPQKIKTKKARTKQSPGDNAPLLKARDKTSVKIDKKALYAKNRYAVSLLNDASGKRVVQLMPLTKTDRSIEAKKQEVHYMITLLQGYLY